MAISTVFFVLCLGSGSLCACNLEKLRKGLGKRLGLRNQRFFGHSNNL